MDPQYTPSDRARFWSKVDTSGDCWIWQGKPNQKGYGRFCFNKHVVLSHRVAWELTNGSIPEGLFVCHRCDNPPCCNPSHLFLGTLTENNQDMWRKGRGKITHQVSRTTFSKDFFQTHRHPRSKVTPEQVTELRRLRSAGWKLKDLAQRYGISDVSAGNIASGKSYPTHGDES